MGLCLLDLECVAALGKDDGRGSHQSGCSSMTNVQRYNERCHEARDPSQRCRRRCRQGHASGAPAQGSYLSSLRGPQDRRWQGSLERLTFMELLKRRGIPYVIYSAEDWAADAQAIDEFERRRKIG